MDAVAEMTDEEPATGSTAVPNTGISTAVRPVVSAGVVRAGGVLRPPSLVGEVFARGLWEAPGPVGLAGCPDDDLDALHIVRGID